MLQAGSVQLLCLTASSGVPLFCRGRGSSKQLPFSVIGSLNGVHMFGSSQDAQICSTATEGGGRVVWRVFQDSVALIAVSSEEGAGEPYLRRLLDNVFNCMVLVLGLDELSRVKNVERLKRDLRSCYRLIDCFLESGGEAIGDLTHCADCLVSPDSGVLQECLDAFTRAAESEFGCLLADGRVVVATEKWWRLAPQEVVLLAFLVRSLASTSSRDCPIFLPQGSPNVPHRLLCFQLVPGVDVCVLCGPTPSLQSAESELVGRFWSPLVEPLRNCVGLKGRCFLGPAPRGILGLLLINLDSSRALYSVQLSQEAAAQDTLPPERRRELLRLFYTLATTRYFQGEPHGEKCETQMEDFPAGFSHEPLQCYLAAAECKCFALQTPQHQLFLLTAPTLPTFTLRTLATRTLSTLLAQTGKTTRN
ncbi:protein fuzzy homolog [Polyodon spathula]|uniref:protein fuzzy homolog n=1 Tax=Polyodon spathula TaxID=7913 RepID=UPI001B7F7618|nr:protein fuzzy homolog [Polyodon spathula]